MICPFCGGQQSKVVDSREARDGRAIRRRRSCELCPGRFTTYETIEEVHPDVIKRDGKRQPFERDKVLRGLRLACQKRPVTLAALTAFVDRLEGEMAALPGRSVTSERLGNTILRFLRQTDAVAYVRYASVYRSFDSVGAFLEELKTLQEDDPTPLWPTGDTDSK